MKRLLGWLVCGLAAGAAHGYDLAYVGDSGTRKVHVFRTDTGAQVGWFTHPNLVTPWAVAVGANRVYVLDQLGSTLYAFDRASGLSLGTVPHGETFVLHMSLAANGELLLGSTNGRAVRVRPDGVRVAEYLQPAFTVANKGVAEGPDGEVYTANFGASRIQRFTAAGVAQGVSATSTQAFTDAEGLQIGHGVGYIALSGTYKVARFAVGNPPVLAGLVDLSGAFNHFLFDAAPGVSPSEFFVAGIDWHGASPVGQAARVSTSTGAVLGTFGQGVLITPRSITVVSNRQATLSGTIDLQDFDADVAGQSVQIDITQAGQVVDSQVVVLGSGGSYSLNTSVSGAADISAKGSHWIRRSVSGVSLVAGGGVSQNFSLENGDIDGDNEVGIGDYAVLSSSYGSGPGDGNWVASADLNGDDGVDIADYAILSANYGLVGD